MRQHNICHHNVFLVYADSAKVERTTDASAAAVCAGAVASQRIDFIEEDHRRRTASGFSEQVRYCLAPTNARKHHIDEQNSGKCK